MSFKKHSKETLSYHRIDIYRADDVAKNGLEANIKTLKIRDKPSQKAMEEVVAGTDFDTYEIAKITEKIERYTKLN